MYGVVNTYPCTIYQHEITLIKSLRQTRAEHIVSSRHSGHFFPSTQWMLLLTSIQWKKWGFLCDFKDKQMFSPLQYGVILDHIITLIIENTLTNIIIFPTDLNEKIKWPENILHCVFSLQENSTATLEKNTTTGTSNDTNTFFSLLYSIFLISFPIL